MRRNVPCVVTKSGRFVLSSSHDICSAMPGSTRPSCSMPTASDALGWMSDCGGSYGLSDCVARGESAYGFVVSARSAYGSGVVGPGGVGGGGVGPGGVGGAAGGRSGAACTSNTSWQCGHFACAPAASSGTLNLALQRVQSTSIGTVFPRDIVQTVRDHIIMNRLQPTRACPTNHSSADHSQVG